MSFEIHRKRFAADDRTVAELRAHVAVGREDVAVAIIVDHVRVQLDAPRRVGGGDIGDEQRRNDNEEAQRKNRIRTVLRVHA